MRLRYTMYAAVAVVILAAGIFYTVNQLRSQNIPTYQSQGVEYGTTYSDTQDKVFLKVNGYPVNYREYAESKHRFANNLRTMQTNINTAVPLHDWEPAEGEVRNQPTRPFPKFLVTEGYKELTAVMEKHGVDAGGLGALIMEYALYSYAVEEGFEIDEDILTEKVKETRAMYESAVLIPFHPDVRVKELVEV